MKEIGVKEGLWGRILLPEHLFIIWEFSRLLFKKMNNDEIRGGIEWARNFIDILVLKIS
jgi:hypothetical protein